MNFVAQYTKLWRPKLEVFTQGPGGVAPRLRSFGIKFRNLGAVLLAKTSNPGPFLDGFGRFWTLLAGFGRFWVPAPNPGPRTLAPWRRNRKSKKRFANHFFDLRAGPGFEVFGPNLEPWAHFDRFWTILTNFGWFWRVLAGFG